MLYNSSSKLWHIMINFCPVITAYGTSSIKQTRKKIALNISHLSSILLKTGNHILHMRIIKFQELAFHKIIRIHTSGYCNLFILRQHRFQYQLIDSLYHFLIIRMSKKEAIVIDILLDNFAIAFLL